MLIMGGVTTYISYIYNIYKYRKLSIKLGFSIDKDAFGYGLVLPHNGTIVVGEGNKIGNYALINVCTCIPKNRIQIGDYLFMGTGAVMSGHIKLGNNVCLGANSVMMKDCEEGNAFFAGVPAKIISRNNEPWPERLWTSWSGRANEIEKLKKRMNL